MKYLLFILSLLFVLFSFSPSIYEIMNQDKLPSERQFVLEHNYLFDYNFYLSRIREGQPARLGGEGRWLVTEKYFNKPHTASLFQIIYLYMGKVGSIIGASPETVYHGSRLIFGFLLLYLIGQYCSSFFSGWRILLSYLFIITAGSWPILVKAGGFYRFATYMGWWSVIDSFQRITFIPHILIGQIFILIFIWRFASKQRVTGERGPNSRRSPGLTLKIGASMRWDTRAAGPVALLFAWGILGFIAGIIFPPALIVVYTVLGVLSFLEILDFGSPIRRFTPQGKPGFTLSLLNGLALSLPNGLLIRRSWLKEILLPRLIFILLSFPSFLYLQMMFKVMPWKALALFDIQHRIPLPMKEYLLALGPVLLFGLLGLVIAVWKGERKMYPVIAWVVSIFLLFKIFESVPQQSPLRFTEGAINIPLGILAAYFFYSLWQWGEKRRGIRVITVIIVITIIAMGWGVMASMYGWMTDQAHWKREGTWAVPIGTQLVYPLKDFMAGIDYLKTNTAKNSVVLGYITAGNFIPAYAGNCVYIGHANTPDEDGKEKIAAKFFSGKMTADEAKAFLKKENISYIYFGPQEREIGKLQDLKSVYPYLKPAYSNGQVIIYKI